jgi:hypothetical protein
MARIRCTTRKSVIPFLPSHLAERPLRRTVTGQSSHLERLHHHLHEEQERQRQEQEQQDSSPSPQQEVESGRQPSPAPQPEMPPAPPQGILAARGDPGEDEDDVGGSSSHSMELLKEQEPKGWIARPITRDAARGCQFHDALDTLLRRAFDRHTWSIEYRCVVYQHRRGLYPDQWEATCLVRRSDDDLRGAEAFLEHYSITESVGGLRLPKVLKNII